MAITYEAKGDGNCAYNAFALFLIDSTNNGNFDGTNNFSQNRQARILELFKKTSLVGAEYDWEKLKDHLSKQTTKDQLEALQVALAIALRAKSIELIGNDKNSEQYKAYLHATTEALVVAFADFKKDDTKNTGANDDIYRRHLFIIDKFKELKGKSSEQGEKELREWWHTSEGVDRFLTEMGNKGKEAGDAELVPLAVYFALDFKYARKQTAPVSLTPYSFGKIPFNAFDGIDLQTLSFTDEKETLKGKSALLRYLTNAKILEGKAPTDTAPYKIMVQNKEELIDKLKNCKDKNQNSCSQNVIDAFVGVWQKHVQPADLKAVTLRNDYAAHWNYEAEKESELLEPLKIAVSVKMPESTPVKNINEVKNIYYDLLTSHGVKDIKVSKPDNNGCVDITGKLNNQAVELQVTQNTVTTKSSHPVNLKLAVEVIALRITEEKLPRSVSMDVSDAAGMKILVDECKKHNITISNLDQIKEQIARQEAAAKKVEPPKPAPTPASGGDELQKLLQQSMQGRAG